MKGFSIAGGSVPGTDHTMPGQPVWRNNQDAFAWREGPDYLIAVVCDGCSSTPHAEVGAKIGAELVVRQMAESVPFIRGNPVFDASTAVLHEQHSIERYLVEFAKLIGGSRAVEQTLLDYFLFTIIGIIMTPEESVVFSLGDGVFGVNGNVEVIAQYDDNAPPYLAYTQMPSLITYQGVLDFTIRAALPTKEVQSILIGSDGVADFLASASLPLPGKKELLGPLGQFLGDDKFVENPDAIRRRLALANREWVEGGHIRKGLLPDDTTLVVIRREPKSEE